MYMVNMTLSVPQEIYKEMKKYPEIKWSEIARQAIIKKIKDLKMLDKLVSKSVLKVENIDKLDEIIKAGLWERHRRTLKRGKAT